MVYTKLHRRHKFSFWFIITAFSGSCVYIFQKAGKCEALNALESLEKQKSICSQEVSEKPSCKSPKSFSKSEDSGLEVCLSKISQDDISTTIAG